MLKKINLNELSKNDAAALLVGVSIDSLIDHAPYISDADVARDYREDRVRDAYAALRCRFDQPMAGDDARVEERLAKLAKADMMNDGDVLAMIEIGREVFDSNEPDREIDLAFVRSVDRWYMKSGD